jgi:hypothetical protein
MISVVASPLASLLADLDLAVSSGQTRRDDHQDYDAGDAIGEIQCNEAKIRSRFSAQAYESMLQSARLRAQESLLGGTAVTPLDIAMMFNVSGRGLGIDAAGLWEKIFAQSPLHIRLSELPQTDDASKLWTKEIDAKLRAFQADLGWLINPLLVPVALEVMIKPPPPSREKKNVTLTTCCAIT